MCIEFWFIKIIGKFSSIYIVGFFDNFDGLEFNVYWSIKMFLENNEGYGGFDNFCLEEEDFLVIFFVI